MPTLICFGKNYQDHMHELGDKPVDKPVIFLKPISVLRACKNWGETLQLYLPQEETHFEWELVFKLKSGGYQLTKQQARDALDCFTIGLDMTKRNLQKQLKEAGHPWTIGKVFLDAAVIGPWIAIENLESCLSESFSFTLNDHVRQNSVGEKMLFSPIDLVVLASQYFPLCEDDILFTGTPAGVGKVVNGDKGVLQLGKYNYFVFWKYS